MTPRPIALLITIVQVVERNRLPMDLVLIHFVRAIFMVIPLVIIFMFFVVIIMIIVMIALWTLSQQRDRGQ